jgi:predicted NAD/FAD-binding protein
MPPDWSLFSREAPGRRVAIIGSGVSGLVAARLLHQHHEVTVFEADARLGGHANTVTIHLDGRDLPVDTGFLVYNERNYPGFVRLLEQLGVATQPSDMSFSVADERTGVQWRGTNLDTVFAQRRRAADPRFLRMLADVARFNRAARALLDDDAGTDLSLTLDDLLARGRYSRWFRDWYLVPMGSAIWSADPTTFLRYPAAVFARFFENHGLLRVGDQPQWRTVTGGSQQYVRALVHPFRHRIRLANPVDKIVRRSDGIEITTVGGSAEQFDRVVVATHSDQALRLLSDPSPAERQILGAIRYQPNIATLHTDATLLPSNPRARAAWNYHVVPEHDRSAHQHRATLTYHLNALQGLDTTHDVCVTLNRPDRPRPDTVIEHIQYAHPVFDEAAVRAQRRLDEINGVDGTYFCGAYWRYGFHEDGVQSGLEVARHFGATL